MNNIAIIVSIAAFCLSLIQFIRNTTRQKKEATLIAYNEVQQDAFSKLNRYANDLSKIRFKSAEWEEITDCLVKIENFSTGINTGIYSITILDRLGGAYFIRSFDRLSPIIDKKRSDNISAGGHYNEFEKTVNRLQKRRMRVVRIKKVLEGVVIMDYEKLRNELRDCYKRSKVSCKEDNEVICAQRIVRKYVGKDKDKLLKLKAQSRYSDFNQMSSSLLTVGALFVSVFSVYITVATGTQHGQPLYNLIILLLLLMVPIIIFIILWNIRCRIVSIWNEYLNVAIDELEKKFDENK